MAKLLTPTTRKVVTVYDKTGLPMDVHTAIYEQLLTTKQRVEQLEAMFRATLTVEQQVIVKQIDHSKQTVQAIYRLLNASRKVEKLEADYWNTDEM